jgi:hypothetical protein
MEEFPQSSDQSENGNDNDDREKKGPREGKAMIFCEAPLVKMDDRAGFCRAPVYALGQKM